VKITDVSLFQVSAALPENWAPNRTAQSRPIDLYDPPAPSAPRSGPAEIRGIYLEIVTDEGLSGLFGPIQRDQAFVIYHHLRPFLLGRDPLATELLYDQMIRLNRHGRSGLFMTGVSPVDCALWDLKGKAWDKPVYRLLGGPTRAAVPAYASMLGYPVEPEAAAATAREYVELGYKAQKWFFAYGPAHGAEGMAKNVAMAQAVREAVGPYYPLMFDAFMSWNVGYASKMAQAIEPFDPTWLEEPVPPERVGELRRIRQASRVPIATGEHVYTRWQTKELLVNEAIDFLQNDPDWTGGITELCKLGALASAFEVPMIAHGHSLLAALHVAGASSPAQVPYVEYLVNSQPGKQFFHDPTYEPVHGDVALPELPGLGLVLDEKKIERREPVTF